MYHHTLKHHNTNTVLSLFSIPFVLKCAAKILKVGLQIKKVMSKCVLNKDFCMGKVLAARDRKKRKFK